MVKQNGFTLIELLIVVAIIGILTVVVVPGYQEYTLKTKRTDGQIALMQAADKQERYYSQNSTYAKDTATLFPVAGDEYSPKKLYLITVTGDTNGFQLSAAAQAEQVADTACTPMTYNQAGTKTPADCWD